MALEPLVGVPPQGWIDEQAPGAFDIGHSLPYRVDGSVGTAGLVDRRKQITDR